MKKLFQKDLLAWYQVHKRPLSFRENKDAYSIWISEIMAQQTRIEAMLEYHSRFLKVLPTMKDLANCDEEKLHKLWQGLGYYSRVRNMKKCAQICMEEYDGKLPTTKKELMNLPGIGAYTAGAIASIAYDENVSAVDGNVIRVFSRLYNIEEDMTKSVSKKHVETLVEASLPGSSYISDFNQALMELGALVCIPQNPRCELCPIQKYCEAKEPSKLPVMIKKKKKKIENKMIYIWAYADKIRVVKRPSTGLLANLYGFDEKRPDSIVSSVQLQSYTHIFSHVEWHMDACLVFTESVDENYYSLDEIKESIVIPSAFLPFLEEIEKERLLWQK